MSYCNITDVAPIVFKTKCIRWSKAFQDAAEKYVSCGGKILWCGHNCESRTIGDQVIPAQNFSPTLVCMTLDDIRAGALHSKSLINKCNDNILHHDD